MRIHNRMESSQANGPGNRAVIWVAGCTLACRGCWNPDTWEYGKGEEINIMELEDWILGLKDIEGITFSGGEPMQQASSLFSLCHFLHCDRPDFSIGMFTGYNLKELENGKFKWRSAYDGEWVPGSQELWHNIRQHMDFVVAGRYLESVRTTEKPLCGSLNQETIFPTGHYSEADLAHQVFEAQIDESGKLVQITGFPVGVEL